MADGLKSAGFAAEAIDVKSRRIPELSSGRFDIFFIAMHGKFGEDGELQAVLEKRRIPFTGSGSAASRRAMDKFETKRLFIKARVPTAPCWFHRKGGKQPLDKLPLPLVVKPRAEGSSVGVSIVERTGELPRALRKAREFDGDVLLEQFVPGRELTVAILGETALPIIELRPKRKFFDFTAKYKDPATEYIVNPALEERATRSVQRIALRAHQALGCEGFSRVDLILARTIHDSSGKGKSVLRSEHTTESPLDRGDLPCGAIGGDFYEFGRPGGVKDEGGEGLVVLEVNSIPGMTERSLVPKAARAAGIEFPELCSRIVRLALER